VSPLRRPAARAALVFAAVVAVDQVTKALVRSGMQRGEEDPILPALKLVHVRNEGVAFGIEAGGQTLVIVLIAFALTVLLLYFARHSARPLMWLPVGLLLGGAVGNIIDRIHQGAVTDFLKLPKWPAFNVADIAITFGVLTLIYVLERRDARDPSPA
jgi:signal peptidase II